MGEREAEHNRFLQLLSSLSNHFSDSETKSAVENAALLANVMIREETALVCPSIQLCH